MKRALPTLIVVSLVATSGCDGLLTVKGKLVKSDGSAPDDCRVELRPADVEAAAWSFHVDADFHDSVTVSPWVGDTYFVSVRCEDGSVSPGKPVLVHGGVREVDLGTILLKGP
jgi:hypothetical protein